MVFLKILALRNCIGSQKAIEISRTLSYLIPNFNIEISEIESKNEFAEKLRAIQNNMVEPTRVFEESPFIYFNENQVIGGVDELIAWSRRLMPTNLIANATKSVEHPPMEKVGHGYNYDLVVIGGGSGGLACSKEASKYGAKVAVLDFVKPTIHGTTWGIGGTCVNVGCIPKKLFHTAALIGEVLKHDQKEYGWISETKGHSWEKLRESVINHIKGLNFKYKVNLREKNVQYLNTLGRFIDNHTLECTDKKGKKTVITSDKFVIAVGGRPTPLDCVGWEHAITSDDLFSLESSPGKTLIVGASYIALECGGFLTGLGLDVTIAVRSILLRGFDREYADIIGQSMEEQGTKFKRQVLPKSIVKGSDGRLTVTLDNGEVDVYDTVIAAIGRTGDAGGLGLENVGVKLESNGKINCISEQTTVDNIYAIGDIVNKCPELTPVAIKAGLILARRLYNGSVEQISYKNVATAVFTPLEYGAVGLGEEQAIAESPSNSIEVYHSKFIPLEWSIVDHRSHQLGCCKVIVDTLNDLVLGIHFLGPNAGEVIQAFSVGVNMGMLWSDLRNTIGIHPTVCEEILDLKITKSSGEDAVKTGC